MKLISKFGICIWYGMAGSVVLSFFFLVGLVVVCVASAGNEAFLKYENTAQMRQDKADELRQAQLEWYKSQTNKEKP